MIQSPFNNLIISVDTKYIRNISNIIKMSAIQQGASVDPVDCVNIVGTVVSLPKAIDDKKEHQGFSCKGIGVGDKIFFSHSVIYSFIQTEPDAEPIYKNMLTYLGKEYFVCDIQYVFGVIKPDGIKMINGYSMIYDFPDDKIILSTQSKKTLKTTASELMYYGTPKEGDWNVGIEPTTQILFNPNKTSKYQIGGKCFRIISQNHILGKTNVTGQVE